MSAGNLFDAPPDLLPRERFETLIDTAAVRVERIISTGQATPPGEWYDQDQDEWVLLLRGTAALRFADEAVPRLLRPGDHVRIAARARHRVEWTDATGPTIWLALHFGGA